MISTPNFGIGGQSLWDKDENFNVSGRKSNSRISNIRGDFYFYLVFSYAILFPPLFILS